MSRTSEQVAADEALAAAADAVHRAYDSEDDPTNGVLVKYLLISQRRWWDEEGQSVTAVYLNTLDDEVPLTDQLGLIEFASTRIRHAIVFDHYDVEDDD